MRGDPSDNLEGVPGVGEKTAAKLLNQYGTLEGVLEHAHEQTPKLRESLTNFGDRARQNFELMVLRRDAPIELDFADATVRPDDAEVKRLFDFLEFRGLYDRLYDALKGIGVEKGAAAKADTASEAAEVLEATVRSLSASDVAAFVAGRELLDVAPAWDGDPGRSALLGLAIVADAQQIGRAHV